VENPYTYKLSKKTAELLHEAAERIYNLLDGLSDTAEMGKALVDNNLENCTQWNEAQPPSDATPIETDSHLQISTLSPSWSAPIFDAIAIRVNPGNGKILRESTDSESKNGDRNGLVASRQFSDAKAIFGKIEDGIQKNLPSYLIKNKWRSEMKIRKARIDYIAKYIGKAIDNAIKPKAPIFKLVRKAGERVYKLLDGLSNAEEMTKILSENNLKNSSQWKDARPPTDANRVGTDVDTWISEYTDVGTWISESNGSWFAPIFDAIAIKVEKIVMGIEGESTYRESKHGNSNGLVASREFPDADAITERLEKSIAKNLPKNLIKNKWRSEMGNDEARIDYIAKYIGEAINNAVKPKAPKKRDSAEGTSAEADKSATRQKAPRPDPKKEEIDDKGKRIPEGDFDCIFGLFRHRLGCCKRIQNDSTFRKFTVQWLECLRKCVINGQEIPQFTYYNPSSLNANQLRKCQDEVKNVVRWCFTECCNIELGTNMSAPKWVDIAHIIAGKEYENFVSKEDPERAEISAKNQFKILTDATQKRQ